IPTERAARRGGDFTRTRGEGGSRHGGRALRCIVRLRDRTHGASLKPLFPGGSGEGLVAANLRRQRIGGSLGGHDDLRQAAGFRSGVLRPVALVALPDLRVGGSGKLRKRFLAEGGETDDPPFGPQIAVAIGRVIG